MAKLIIPGDRLAIRDDVPITVGAGVYCDPRTQVVLPVNAGLEVVRETKKGQAVYVDYNASRYVPSIGDFVVGTIISSFSDSYKVSLASFSTPVVLPYMAFPNASKKNRPTLKVGDLCYARVSSAEKDLEAVLECMDSSTGRDAGFGQLDGGMVAEVSLGFARELLLNEAFPLLPEMARHAQFEVAIGVNGKIWVKAETVRTTLCCIRAIEACQERPQAEFKTTVKRVFKELREGTE